MENMECRRMITYVIKEGDNYYFLAKQFDTTVNMLLQLNPGVDPYNLQIGSSIMICPGENWEDNGMRPRADCAKQLMLTNQMRLAWSQHIYWTRILLISIAERLKDQNDTAARLLRNPDDIAKIFAVYYPPAASRTISALLTEHLQIGAELITALRDKRVNDANALDRQWYINADRMADAFSGINPYYKREEVRKMLYTHLDLTKQEVAMRLAGNYPADIDAFDKVEAEAMMMADYFVNGIIMQFPQKFQ